MNILMIAPAAPPKNSSEAIQVGRYLQELDRRADVTLVTTCVAYGWVSADATLATELLRTRTITLGLPVHRLATRLLGSRYARPLTGGASEFWIAYKGREVVRRLHNRPDVIYSRSTPFSAALLARDLKRRLRLPWVMHLSDPWSDSPYRTHDQSDREVENERRCFAEADVIALTTESMAQFYRCKYPSAASKIMVSPNVMPAVGPVSDIRKLRNDGRVRLVYTGALYGARRPTTLLAALDQLAKSAPDLANRLEFLFVGNVTEDIRVELLTPNRAQVSLRGKCSFAEAAQFQAEADIVISIEPDGEDPLLKSFLPAKMLDYVAARKPVLAVTPEGSESWKLCNTGYGWAIRPSDSTALPALLARIATEGAAEFGGAGGTPLPVEYSAAACVENLLDRMRALVKTASPRHDGRESSSDGSQRLR